MIATTPTARFGAESRLGDIVAADFRSASIFDAIGIDYCCGGDVTLAQVCGQKGLDSAALIGKIESATAAPLSRNENYAAWEPSFLADYIVNVHHSWLRENDGSIVAYTAKIASVHGSRHPELAEIAAIFAKVAADMEVHLREEEDRFFPAIRRIQAAVAAGSSLDADDKATLGRALESLGRDHEEIGEATHRIRALSKAYALPEDACSSYAVTYAKLAEFEDDLHKHVHLENNILFPKARAFLV
ncbi:MAG TPA: iron-sulfur cluster repair di-iron protein [Rectinemataceae bacterium]|nr:iron-sulfur cluster repair di-iron protein [Rectinemataceae bacterium]